MKKQNLTLSLLFLFCICFTMKMHGQATFVNGLNTPNASGDFLGWATGSLGTVSELTIKVDENMPISFYTNAGGGLSNMRMWIYEDITNAGASNAGFVGIGDFATVPATPQQLLHMLSAIETIVYAQWTNKNTGHRS